MSAHVQESKFRNYCPSCGALERLYRTPRGLRCAKCIKRMDSAGLGFV